MLSAVLPTTYGDVHLLQGSLHGLCAVLALWSVAYGSLLVSCVASKALSPGMFECPWDAYEAVLLFSYLLDACWRLDFELDRARLHLCSSCVAFFPQDFRGFRVIVLLSRFRPGWPAPGAYEREGTKACQKLGGHKDPLPVLLVEGKPMSAATIRRCASCPNLPPLEWHGFFSAEWFS